MTDKYTKLLCVSCFLLGIIVTIIVVGASFTYTLTHLDINIATLSLDFNETEMGRAMFEYANITRGA